jgi:hypothetical protein
MVRVMVFVRDFVIALALGWIGVSITPAPREESCALKGPDIALCASTRAPTFNLESRVRDMGCPNG